MGKAGQARVTTEIHERIISIENHLFFLKNRARFLPAGGEDEISRLEERREELVGLYLRTTSRGELSQV